MASVSRADAAEAESRATPVGAVIGAMLSFQYGAVLGKSLFPEVGAQGATLFRLGMGALILAVVTRPWRTPPPRRALPVLLGYGATLAAMNTSFYAALRTLPLGIAIAIEFLGPLAVATFASRRATDFIWAGLALAGVLLLSPPFPGMRGLERGLDPGGVALALTAGACWAVYILLGQKAGRAMGTRATAFGMAAGAVLMLPVGIAHAGGALLHPRVLTIGAAVGLFSGALPFSLEMFALTRLPARVYATLASLEPGIGALMGLALLGEALAPAQWVGIGTVTVAAIGAAATMRRAGATAAVTATTPA